MRDQSESGYTYFRKIAGIYPIEYPISSSAFLLFQFDIVSYSMVLRLSISARHVTGAL